MPIEELKTDQFRAFTGSKEGPAKIVGAGLDTSEACDMKCVNCYRQPWVEQSGYMMPQIASKAMRSLREADVYELYLLGAEPTMNPHLPDIVEEAVNSGFKFVLLISHGLRFADERYARKVLIPGVSLLMHRHTMDNGVFAEKIQDEAMGVYGTLEHSHAAWANVTKIFEEKGGDDKLMLQSCLNEAVMSGDNLDKVFRWGRERLGELPIMEYVAPPHGSIEKQLEWFATYPQLTEKIVAQLGRFRKIDEQLGLTVPAYKDAVSPQAYNSSCTMLREGGQIANDGVYAPCTNMGRRSMNPLEFGNILSGSFGKIEQSPIREAFLKPNFRVLGCEDPCQGSGCWWTGLVTTGCYRLCQLNCVFNEKKITIDDVQDLCKGCPLDSLRQKGVINCGPGTRPGLVLGEAEKSMFTSLVTS